MSLHENVITVACAALLIIPESLSAQDTTKRDTTRRDTVTRRAGDSTVQIRDTLLTRRTTTTMPFSSALRSSTPRNSAIQSSAMTSNTRPARSTAMPPQVYSQQRVRVQKDYGTTMRPEPTPIRDSIKVNTDSIAERAHRDSIEKTREDSVSRAARRQRDSLSANAERMRADSAARLEQLHNDSLAALETMRRDSNARADSIAQLQQTRNRYHFNNSGWYIGVSGGGTMPKGDFKDLGYDKGLDVNVPIGWHRPTNLLGFRVDLGYSAFDGRTFAGTGPSGTALTLTNGSPKVMSATLNLTARVPLTPSHRLSVYALGGGGLYHFRNFGGASALGGFLGNDVLETPDPSAKTTRNKLGYQAGGGLDLSIGATSVFLESRFVNVFADRDESVAFNDFFGPNRSKNVRWVPIALGVSIR